jgi:hypothetical protein
VATTASGTPVWVVDADKNVYVYDGNGNALGSWTARKTAAENADLSASVQGIATDGTNIWIVDDLTNEVFYYAGGAAWRDNAAPRNATSKFTLGTGNTDPRDLTFGTITASNVTKRYLWVVNDSTADKVFRYELKADNTVQAVTSWTINTANSKPTGITLDPTGASHDLWIVDDGATADKVFRYANAKSRSSGTAPAAPSWALAGGNSSPQGIADPLPGGLAVDSVAEAKASTSPASKGAAAQGLSAPSDAQQSMNQRKRSLGDAAPLVRWLAKPASDVAASERSDSTNVADAVWSELGAIGSDDCLLPASEADTADEVEKTIERMLAEAGPVAQRK